MALPGALPIPNPCRSLQEATGSHQQQAAHVPGKIPAQTETAFQRAPRAQDEVLCHVAPTSAAWGPGGGGPACPPCSSDLSCLGSREAGGPPACPPAQRGSGPQCLRPAFLPGLGPPCARLRPAVRCCPSPPASPASARLATFLLLPSLCRHVPRLCVPGAPPSHPGSCPLWPFVEGTGVLFNHWAQPLLPSPRPALGTVSDCVWGRSDVPDTRRQ